MDKPGIGSETFSIKLEESSWAGGVKKYQELKYEDLKEKLIGALYPKNGSGELDKIFGYIEGDYRFIKKKHNPLTKGMWESFEDGKYGSIVLNKNIGRKGLAQVRVKIMDETKDGIEVVIEMELASGGVWETFFEGFVENLDEFKLVFRMLGLLIN